MGFSMNTVTSQDVNTLQPIAKLKRKPDHQNNFRVYYARKSLDVKGQGTVGFNIHATERFRIQLRSGCSCLMVDIGKDQTSFRSIAKGKTDRILYQVNRNDVTSDPFLNPDRELTYWLSLDRNNNLLRFGKGEMIAELCELEFDLSQLRENGELDWLTTLDRFGIAGNYEKAALKKIKPVYKRLPVTVSAPPIIVSQDQIDLCQIDSNNATVISNLSEECTQLYNNIAGRNLTLNAPDFTDFSDAINWSIMTEGAICNTRLKEKSANLPEDRKKQCYLRITVGENLGDSPGVPYVLEIWPGQHYSPVHRHAECNAIIKVLHGSLSCRWFSSLHAEDDTPYQQAVVSASQVTWLDPGQFQTHQLYNHNIEGNMCATIQCYKYSKDDHQHYEYFDYINDKTDEVCQFTPTADWRFSDFKEQIRAEWNAYKDMIKNIGPCSYKHGSSTYVSSKTGSIKEGSTSIGAHIPNTVLNSMNAAVIL